jgi:hypothetical protein
MDRGEAAEKMLVAAALGHSFEDSGVPDTIRNRKLFAQTEAQINALPDGTIVSVPGE